MPLTVSSSIERVYYDARQRTLKVIFRASQKTYLYEGVDEDVYNALMEAESVGAYFNANIRDRYPFREVEK
jgi:hypothetical protein